MKYLTSAFALCGLLLLGACDSATTETTLNIGVVLPSTGDLGTNGVLVQRGLDLARDEINDSKALGDTRVAFITANNESTPEGSATAFGKLINDDKVQIIIGPITSTSTDRITSIVDGAGVVSLGPSSAASGLAARTQWLFRTSLTVDHLVPSGIAIAKRHLGFENVATILNDRDVFANSVHRKVLEAVDADEDIMVVEEVVYSREPNADMPDLTAALTALKNAEPDAIFLSGLPEDALGVFTQAHALGITDTPYITTLLGLAEIKRIEAAAPGATENTISFQIWLSNSEAAASRTFVTNYMARHGETPGDWSARGYMTMHLLAHVLKDASNYEAETVRGLLAAVKDIPTVYGSFSFDEHGDAVYDPIVAQVKGGEFVIVN